MRGFSSFFKKELFELLRTGKLVLLALLFVLFGLMNPAVAKLTPWLMELAADSLEGQGLTVGEVTVTAMDSWAQFAKNIPMVLIMVLVMFSGIFTAEYAKGTLIPIVTKGLSRVSIMLAKTAVMFLVWTLGCLTCASLTYAYSAFYWDNSVVSHIPFVVFGWWLLGIFLLCALVFFSSLANSASLVLLGVGGLYGAMCLGAMFGKAGDYLPTALSDSTALMTGQSMPSDYDAAVLITVGAGAILLLAAGPIMKKRLL